MAKETHGNMTIDDLAGMVQRGFHDLENRLGERMEEQGRQTNRRFGQTDEKLDDQSLRLDRIERKLDATIHATDRHDDTLRQHDRAITKLKFKNI